MTDGVICRLGSMHHTTCSCDSTKPINPYRTIDSGACTSKSEFANAGPILPLLYYSKTQPAASSSQHDVFSLSVCFPSIFHSLPLLTSRNSPSGAGRLPNYSEQNLDSMMEIS